MSSGRIMFLSWGRKGGATPLARAVGREALAMPDIQPTISVSRQNEEFASFASFGDALFPVDTFGSSYGALTGFWRIPGLRRQLAGRIARDRIQAVVTIMPHVWTPFMVGAIRRADARYVTIIHDAKAHPGDPTAIVNRLLLTEARHADRVVTLSQSVRDGLVSAGVAQAERITPLFLPDLAVDASDAPRRRVQGSPFRLLFLGRILRYKGLGLFVDAAELLRRRGIPVEIGIFGEGSLSPFEDRLAALGAEVVNRWLSEDEIADALARYDAMALSYVEASQSGVAAAALGSGLPVVATPVGGLKEQIRDGRTGLLARDMTAAAFAEAVERLAGDARLYDDIAVALKETASERSVRRFTEALIAVALG
ncbi:glycosyltransferase family 4 protein [Mesorhizobium sp. 1B3]|uniref:glycosyltransferase family 4 protein n=1 Tax=Mesorhizobium sp. 1B3 TaxID=3243599 RepID=UPI003D95331D